MSLVLFGGIWYMNAETHCFESADKGREAPANQRLFLRNGEYILRRNTSQYFQSFYSPPMNVLWLFSRRAKRMVCRSFADYEDFYELKTRAGKIRHVK